MADPSGVTTADRALLEMALQNVAARKGITTQHTHVGAVAGV